MGMITVRDVPEQEFLADRRQRPGGRHPPSPRRWGASTRRSSRRAAPTCRRGPLVDSRPRAIRSTTRRRSAGAGRRRRRAPDGASPGGPVRRERLAEGRSAEGCTAARTPTRARRSPRSTTWIAAQGLERRGRHDETRPRRSAHDRARGAAHAPAPAGRAQRVLPRSAASPRRSRREHQGAAPRRRGRPACARARRPARATATTRGSRCAAPPRSRSCAGSTCPLATIRGVLDAADPRAPAGRLPRSGPARSASWSAGGRRNLRALERLLGAAEGCPTRVALAGQPALRLGGAAGEVCAETIGADVAPLAEAALGAPPPRAGRRTRAWIGVYPLELTDPVHGGAGRAGGGRVEAVAEAPGGLAGRPPCTSAATTSSARLRRPCSAGRTSTGTSRAARVLETYLNDPRTTPEHELATRVAVLLG